MKYFEKYVSNTYAGGVNQLQYSTKENEIKTGRVFYKITIGGEYEYSILFSNIIESTFSDGSLCHKNVICDSWTIHSARIGRCKEIDNEKDITGMTVADLEENIEADIIVSDFKELTFGGQKTKEVMPGEFFSCDPIKLKFDQGEYLCLEVSFSGETVPHQEETLLPVYVKENGEWKYSKNTPFAAMIGCDREVKKKITFLGDSITQGLGTRLNRYEHWSVFLADKIGDEYAYWNLGIGHGRANDLASEGAWAFKAKQNDIAFVCYGVNDIMQGFSEEQIKADLATIIKMLKKADMTVILQTVPPFDYSEDKIGKWERVNDFIKTELKDKVDLVFDNVLCLGKEERPSAATYGGHPDKKGCEVWADALYDTVKHLF